MHNQAQFKTVVKTNMLVDFNERGQQEMDFFTEESVFLDYLPRLVMRNINWLLSTKEKLKGPPVVWFNIWNM